MGKKKKGGTEGQRKTKKDIIKEQEELRLKLKLEEEEKERQQKLEKERLKNLAKLAKEKEKTLLLENEIRNDILNKICQRFREIEKERLERALAQREQESWEHYLKCDGKPEPDDTDGLNYYLYKWNNDDQVHKLANFLQKSDEVFEILDLMEEYIRCPLSSTNYTVKLWKEMQKRFQDELCSQIDKTTYDIIHNVEVNMENTSEFSAKLVRNKKNFALGLWAKKQVADPCPCPDKTEPYFPIAELPEVNVSVNVPYQLAYDFYVVRVNWFKYDSYSDSSRTSQPKLMPDEYLRDLFEYNRDEYELGERLKQEYEEELRQRRERKKKRRKKERPSTIGKGSKSSDNPLQKMSTDISLGRESIDLDTQSSIDMDQVDFRGSRPSFLFAQDLPPDTTLKLPSENLIQIDEANQKFLKRYLEMYMPEPDELNLRQFMILGGVYNIDFLEALPQPVILPDRSVICLTYGESLIKYIKFDWKNNHIQRKSLKKLREYYDELSKYLDLGKLDTKSSLRDVFMGTEARPSKYFIPGEIRVSLVAQEFCKDFWRKKDKKNKKEKSDDAVSSTHDDESEVEEKEQEMEEIDEDGIHSEIDFDAETSSEDEEDDEGEIERLSFGGMDSLIEDDGQDKDAFDEKRKYDEEISILEFDEINFKPEIFLKLNDEVYWFKRPFPVTWDSEKKYWSTTQGMLNKEFNDGKQEISFRMEGHRTPIGLAVPRYLNLPFNKWELEPIFDNSGKPTCISFNLSSLQLSINFKIKDRTVCIDSLKTSVSRDILGEKLGKYYKPDNLIRILEKSGIDIFPDYDAYIYTNSTPKHWICEKHVYTCISLACTTHQFQSSKWNQMTTPNKIIVNLRERFPNASGLNYKLTMITPQRALFLNMNELSQDFNETEEEGTAYHPDLYFLINAHSSTMAKLNMDNIDMNLVDTVYTMITRTRIFSYS